ncbi:hypothetical protein [Streptomyces sp. NPDC002215]
MNDLTLFTDTTPVVTAAPSAEGATAPVVHGAVIISAVETSIRRADPASP